jgi:Arm DNA-binding domain
MTDIRITLSDKAIAQLPTPEDGWYLARDTELKGFFVVVGKRKRTLTVQGDLRQRGKRASSVRVSIGDASELTTRAARAIAKEYLAQISKGQHPKARLDGKAGQAETDANSAVAAATLRQAWQRYLEAHLIRKSRSEKTINGYRDELSLIFGDGRGRSGGGGCGLTVGRLGDDLDPVFECHTENEFWQLVMTVETAPAFLRALDEFEDHRERGPIR